MKTGIDTSGYQALRRYRCSVPNQIYLITFATIRRERIFFDNHSVACTFCLALNDPRLWQDAKLLCWVLMPDHVHLLIQLGERESLSALIKRLKANTARAVNITRKTSSALWEKGFHDKAIRQEEDIVGVARYIVMNPVRACLVKSAGMYSYWNAAWL